MGGGKSINIGGIEFGQESTRVFGVDIPNWVPLPKGVGMDDLLEWERQVYTIEEWRELIAIAEDYYADLSVMVKHRLYGVRAILFGFVEFNHPHPWFGSRLNEWYGPFEALQGDQTGNSFAVFSGIDGAQSLKILMKAQVKCEWLQARLVERSSGKTLSAWSLTEPIVLDTLNSLTTPVYEVVYRRAIKLI